MCFVGMQRKIDCFLGRKKMYFFNNKNIKFYRDVKGNWFSLGFERKYSTTSDANRKCFFALGCEPTIPVFGL